MSSRSILSPHYHRGFFSGSQCDSILISESTISAIFIRFKPCIYCPQYCIKKCHIWVTALPHCETWGCESAWLSLRCKQIWMSIISSQVVVVVLLLVLVLVVLKIRLSSWRLGWWKFQCVVNFNTLPGIKWFDPPCATVWCMYVNAPRLSTMIWFVLPTSEDSLGGFPSPDTATPLLFTLASLRKNLLTLRVQQVFWKLKTHCGAISNSTTRPKCIGKKMHWHTYAYFSSCHL